MTSDGNGLLKFHSGLLAQVLAFDAPVTAAHICYDISPENGPDVKVSERVCYWGDMVLLPHIFHFLGLLGVKAQVRFAAEPIVFSNHSSHRKRAAREGLGGGGRAWGIFAGGVEEVHHF